MRRDTVWVDTLKRRQRIVLKVR